ncbi:hypothetical protein HMI54_006069 [Coelomomyces lativittatus]|nr:hypothetical protein HMI54_006069 [Coelomomyces lativittatus]KAJ1510718.1 hypothetical protein HMI55_006882 [Coelomomyces lativittatus]KAJ1512619.1 hypothetical protein HMI56_003808 [Coelomomyces lativittatus]
MTLGSSILNSKSTSTSTSSTSSSTSSTSSTWTPESWKSKSRTHDIDFDAQSIFEKLQQLPPLVSQQEIQTFQDYLGKVANKECFILQGGDCAELFDYCNSEQIECRLNVLFQMAWILKSALNLPIVLIARMAGQFAKPRTTSTELIDGINYVTFRGENINGYELSDRNPNPNRLLSAYFHSTATLNYIRTLLSTDTFTQSCKQSLKRTCLSTPSLAWMLSDLSFNTPSSSSPSLPMFPPMFTSHEGLTLNYETCFTRPSTMPSTYYNQSAHFLWLGDKTRSLEGGHVEYFRGLANPIGIKISTSLLPEDLVSLLDHLNPLKTVNKVVLITRYGCQHISNWLPSHIRAVQLAQHPVIWFVDPMHGNTIKVKNNLKTRVMDHIWKEIELAFTIHQSLGSFLGGLHLELTGEPVTECIGGSQNVQESDLTKNYQTKCDPRLNNSQSLDIAILMADLIRKNKKPPLS